MATKQLALFAQEIGQFETALYLYFECLENSKLIMDNYEIASNMYSIAFLYERSADYNKAVEFSEKSLK